MFGQMIQNILVYVIMINVLQGLVTSQGFREIFRFVGGMILIVLCVSPILSRISDTDQIGKYLEEKLFQGEMDQLEQETKLAEGDFEKIMLRRCRSELEEQVNTMVEKEGKTSRKVEVALKKNRKGSLQLKQVTVILENDNIPVSAPGKGSSIRVQDIVIDDQMDHKLKTGSVTTDADTAKLQQQICKKYELSKKKVIVWKKCGKN